MKGRSEERGRREAGGREEESKQTSSKGRSTTNDMYDVLPKTFFDEFPFVTR